MNQLPLIAEVFPPPTPPNIMETKAPPKRAPTSAPAKLPKTCDQELVALAEARLSPKTVADQHVTATQMATADVAKLRAQHVDPRALSIAGDEAICYVNRYLSTLARLLEPARDAPQAKPRAYRPVERATRAPATPNFKPRRRAS